jgi:hypothetical protein
MGSEYINNIELEKNIAELQKAKKSKARYALVIEDLKDTILRKSIRKNNLENEKEKLEYFTLLCSEAQNSYKEVELKLSAAFFLLSENLTRYFKFHLIEPDDAIQEGVMICFEKIDRFIPTKGKAFNFFTTLTANHYRQLHRTSKNYNELKKKFYIFKQASETKTIIKNGKEVPFYK